MNFPELPSVGGGADPPRKPPGSRLLPATRRPGPSRGPRRMVGGYGRRWAQRSRRAVPGAPPRRPQSYLRHTQPRAPRGRLPRGSILNLQARPPSRRCARPAPHWLAAVTWRPPPCWVVQRSASRHLRPERLAHSPPLCPARKETKCCRRDNRRRRGLCSALPVTHAPYLP